MGLSQPRRDCVSKSNRVWQLAYLRLYNPHRAMNDTERRADLNMWESFRALARITEAGEVREEGGLLVVATGLPTSAFNLALVTRPLDDPARQLGGAVAYFEARDLPFSIRVREGLDPAVEAAIQALGIPHDGLVPAMFLDDASARGSFVEGLSMAAADSEAVLEDHRYVAAEGFGMPVVLARQLLPPAAVRAADVEFFVGYYEGRPVATSALILTPGVAGVYNVATIPAFRRRGIGAAMTWHAIRRGYALGCPVATLQSSKMGLHVYEQMGFRHAGSYHSFARDGDHGTTDP